MKFSGLEVSLGTTLTISTRKIEVILWSPGSCQWEPVTSLGMELRDGSLIFIDSLLYLWRQDYDFKEWHSSGLDIKFSISGNTLKTDLKVSVSDNTLKIPSHTSAFKSLANRLKISALKATNPTHPTTTMENDIIDFLSLATCPITLELIPITRNLFKNPFHSLFPSCTCPSKSPLSNFMEWLARFKYKMMGRGRRRERGERRQRLMGRPWFFTGCG